MNNATTVFIQKVIAGEPWTEVFRAINDVEKVNKMIER